MTDTGETDELERSSLWSTARPKTPALLLVSTRGTPLFRALTVGGGADVITLGRDHALRDVPDTAISRTHASVAYDASSGLWTITDHGARNGTFVDGRPIHEGVRGAVGSLQTASFRTLRLANTILTPVADGADHSKLPGDLRLGADDAGFARGAAMRAALGLVAEAAQEGHVALLLGPSGTGKEGLARHYHASSGRPRAPFVAFNCASVDAHNAEARLFGSTRGAYTGSIAAQSGVIRDADGGTLFLDELGELDLSAQTKLLRALETKEIVPLGASKPIAVDVRFVAATSKELPAEIRAGRFREELWHRLATSVVRVPPVRDRPEEIPFVVAAFADEGGRTPSSRFVEHCMLRAWNGNVRELRNAVYHASKMAKKDGAPCLEPGHLEGFVEIAVAAPTSTMSHTASGPHASERPMRTPVSHEAETVRATFLRVGGNVQQLAEALGIGKTKAYELLKEFGITRK